MALLVPAPQRCYSGATILACDDQGNTIGRWLDLRSFRRSRRCNARTALGIAFFIVARRAGMAQGVGRPGNSVVVRWTSSATFRTPRTITISSTWTGAWRVLCDSIGNVRCLVLRRCGRVSCYWGRPSPVARTVTWACRGWGLKSRRSRRVTRFLVETTCIAYRSSCWRSPP